MPEFKISVLVFLRDAAGRHLLIRRRKAPNLGCWSPIGGKLEMARGESPFECAVRETAEETGLAVTTADLHLFGYVSEKNYEGGAHWLMFLFDCRKPIPQLPPTGDEGQFGFFTREEIETLAIPPSDRTLVWPFYDKHRKGFVALRADCAPNQPLEVLIEQLLPGPQRHRPRHPAAAGPPAPAPAALDTSGPSRRNGRSMEVVIRESRLGGVGLPPGQVDQTSGEAGHAPIRMRVLGYGPDGCFKLDTNKLDDALSRIGEKPVTWIQVIGISHVGFIQEIGHRLNIHPLALEDVATTWGRSKLQDYHEQLFVVSKAAIIEPTAQRLSIEQVSLVVGSNYLVSFQETEGMLFDPVEERILDPQRVIRKKNAGYLLFALLDTLVDHLLASIDAVEEEIIQMEDDVLNRSTSLNIDDIYRRKRIVLMLSRIASPMQELAKRLEMLDSELVPDSLDYYFRDLADHSTRAAERIVHARAVLQNLQEYYHMEGEHRNNDVMRVLTVVATIFIPITFVAGVYGMNFDVSSGPWSMPELYTEYGYPITLTGMCLYALACMVYFKRKDWL